MEMSSTSNGTNSTNGHTSDVNANVHGVTCSEFHAERGNGVTSSPAPSDKRLLCVLAVVIMVCLAVALLACALLYFIRKFVLFHCIFISLGNGGS